MATTGKEGWEVLKTIRSNAKLSQIRVIMLAEEFSPAIIQRVREQKADDVFDEDFTEGDLVRRLEFLLRKKCDGSNQPQPHTPIFGHNFTSLCPNYQQKGLDVSQQPLFFDGRGGL